jgi:hypothetical protein
MAGHADDERGTGGDSAIGGATAGFDEILRCIFFGER